uniref:Uncharacterized protein n=1 Tax=Anguilla anguilla TaxID=7936 RepID=A0A0E9TFG8_ANGAN
MPIAEVVIITHSYLLFWR